MTLTGYLVLMLPLLVVGLILGFRRYRKVKVKPNFPFKDTWDYIEVDLDCCEILSRAYFEEMQPKIFPAMTAMIDSIRITPQESRVQKEVSAVVYRHPQVGGGDTVFRSETLPVSEERLRHLFFDKKITRIYVNPHDISSYYFDLDFIRS